jgi:endonuclease YncB( thermonuclease family)
MSGKMSQHFRRSVGLATVIGKFIFGLGMIAGVTFPAQAANVNIIDGDTLSIDGTRIRIVQIDTPETYQSRCEKELELGLKAKERLRALLDQGPVHYEATGTDRYSRILARVYVDLDDGPVDVGETLITEGFALPYRPGAKDKLRRLKIWCGQDAKLSY